MDVTVFFLYLLVFFKHQNKNEANKNKFVCIKISKSVSIKSIDKSFLIDRKWSGILQGCQTIDTLFFGEAH